MSKANPILDKCPIDGNLFDKVQSTQIYCSPKCKKLGDNETRRHRKFITRSREYARLGKLICNTDAQNVVMLRKQLTNADDALLNQARVIFVGGIIAVAVIIALVVW